MMKPWTMEPLTISKAFLDLIGDRRVVCGFFSTYCFEPEFFELEVLPLMLGNRAWSANEGIRYYQLQSCLQAHKGNWAVAYDADVFSPQAAPRLEVDYLPVRVSGCQHAKLSILLLQEGTEGKKSVLLAAGSFNLTRAGWWENLEVGHWVELGANAPRNILKPLQDALAFYSGYGDAAALQMLQEHVASMSETPDDPCCAFYFSGTGDNRQSFPSFLKKARGRGSLEIISPFFAEQGDNQIISSFLSQFEQRRVLLPLDEHDTALIDEPVYTSLVKEVEWGRWLPEQYRQFMSGISYRRLHAKIYRTLGADAWCFVGSVNLSFKAFMQNVEAGFLLSDLEAKAMLAPFDDKPSSFACSQEAPSEGGTDAKGMPVIRLVYDWQDGLLHVWASQSGQLTLLDSQEGGLITLKLEVDDEAAVHFEAGRQLFERSSLVHAHWQAGGTDCLGLLLVSQHNIYCRPTGLPSLDLPTLLRIFQGLDDESRLELISPLVARMIHLDSNSIHQDENLPELPADNDAVSFFSEFSQVNGAFWSLGRRLVEAEQQQDEKTLAYFLKGRQPDSLASVIEQLEQGTAEGKPPMIVRYLSLLSIRELLHRHVAYADNNLLPRVARLIETLERDELYELLTREGHDASRFIGWFRAQFTDASPALQQIEQTEQP